ncbi:LysR substrate-binding domain-containing protein [Dactylosporangium sp. CA-233914]|uniref:LysR substrate-binding domain-containing protein n=1 Tax=Dactylosporangium sp. CA-233914 TaxID=3239934 RepID=UPI003D90AC45
MHQQLLINLVGWAGAATLVLAYALVSTQRLVGDGVAFQAMNIAGAVALTLNSAVHGAWPSAVLNVVWVGIGAVAMYRLARRSRKAAQQVAEQAAERELAAPSGRVSGQVRVAAFSTAIRHLLIPAMDRLAREHPGVVCSITEMEGAPALRELRRGVLDLTITDRDASLGLESRQQVSVVPLREDPYRVVVPAGWPPVHDYGDLADRPWIAGPPSSTTGQVLERLGRQRSFTPRRAHVCVDYPAVFALVAAGHGAAITPDLALRGIGRDADRLRVTDLPGPGARHLDVLVAAGREGQPAVEALLAALRKVAQ